MCDDTFGALVFLYTYSDSCLERFASHLSAADKDFLTKVSSLAKSILEVITFLPRRVETGCAGSVPWHWVGPGNPFGTCRGSFWKIPGTDSMEFPEIPEIPGTGSLKFPWNFPGNPGSVDIPGIP